MKRAVVIFSGGQDSTTCLIDVLQSKKYDDIHCITFNYGQRHLAEIEIAQKIIKTIGIKIHKVFNLSLLNDLTINSLTRANIPISFNNKQQKKQLPSTFVPGRNILFLILASIYAYQVDARVIIIGVSEVDFSGYPDCRDEFIKAQNIAINLGLARKIRFETPLINLNKAEIWALADYYGYIDNIRYNTLTCYNGIKGDGCKFCDACNLRSNGLSRYEEDKKSVMDSLKSKKKLI